MIAFSLYIFSIVAQAACDYSINQVSPFFFSANITVTNSESVAVNSWDVTIGFTDATRISNNFTQGSFRLNRSGSGPYTFTGANSILRPGESTSFTIQGNGGAAIPTLLDGSLCGSSGSFNTSLTIVKEVVNDDDGTSSASDFGITSNAGGLIFGTPTGTGTVANPLIYSASPITGIAPGTYSLSETDTIGYTEGSWSCTGAAGQTVSAFDNGSVEIADDEDVICTIINNDIPGAVAGECEHNITSWGRSFNGTITITNTGLLPINGWEVDWSYSDGSTITSSFNVVRTGSNPYNGSNVGFNATIPVGGSRSFGFSGRGGEGVLASLSGPFCSTPFSATNQTQTLTIKKEILNDNGGTAVVGDFAIATDAGLLDFDAGTTQGDTTTYRSTALTVAAGTYTLAESDLAAYSEGTLSIIHI